MAGVLPNTLVVNRGNTILGKRIEGYAATMETDESSVSFDVLVGNDAKRSRSAVLSTLMSKNLRNNEYLVLELSGGGESPDSS